MTASSAPPPRRPLLLACLALLFPALASAQSGRISFSGAVTEPTASGPSLDALAARLLAAAKAQAQSSGSRSSGAQLGSAALPPLVQSARIDTDGSGRPTVTIAYK